MPGDRPGHRDRSLARCCGEADDPVTAVGLGPVQGLAAACMCRSISRTSTSSSAGVEPL
jgi:hypothetical protein